mgnify:CR=1 FL=1
MSDYCEFNFADARRENCFRCWHCRRVEGTNAFCVCMAMVTKSIPPDLVMSPYSGKCESFYDRKRQMGIWGGDMESVDIPRGGGKRGEVEAACHDDAREGA